ncbi:DUF421 domain-containing protein [Nocardioides sp. Kera G14]|uniref:DUF421 domain-containing protein n=1 Tax=Nocardioides sp. Kera G14 TaxID=2884264 RepID=UPI001D115A1F|nr:YetF domain-containing protein [Nocardioides sp. Kera G14]UDY23170.1 DUF421 domain-containing protein [Nocardioides sp. Kera G14]
MWNDLMHVQVSLADKVLRTVLVYAVLVIILRLVGKRDLAQINTFDLVVMLLLSNVVQNAIIGPDNSFLGGAIGAVVLVAANSVVVRLIRRHNRIARLFEGTPTTLVRDGEWDDRGMADEGLRRADVDAALRRQGANKVEEVKELTIEPGGSLVATLKPEYESATQADIARLEAKLDQLLRRLDS